MRKQIVQILGVIFLLVLAGNTLANILHPVANLQSIDHVFSDHNEVIKNVKPSFSQSFIQNSNLNSIHLDDNTDLSDSDNSETLNIVGVLTKVLAFTFLLSFLNTKYVKHFFLYNAFIRLFTQKYIVLRSLRI